MNNKQWLVKTEKRSVSHWNPLGPVGFRTLVWNTCSLYETYADWIHFIEKSFILEGWMMKK